MSDWQPVESRAFTAVKHDGGAMHIRYASGGEYVHPGVSEATFEGFMNAFSKGQYFHAHIARKHPGSRVG